MTASSNVMGPCDDGFDRQRANIGWEAAEAVRATNPCDFGDCADGAISRAMADLMHYAAQAGLDVVDEVGEAVTMYREECGALPQF